MIKSSPTVAILAGILKNQNTQNHNAPNINANGNVMIGHSLKNVKSNHKTIAYNTVATTQYIQPSLCKRILNLIYTAKIR
jgi:hypothetical protein